ncbi:hypothetical protein BDFB_004479 [Asbolus verrucosus]|uniref:Uncharacterized protein n=1 Tax=Asbolus verrucosus TaxID=1661398 RepID=A0A482VLX6_ASBVE|nr:hypothetical protein BDFB_004479 [Asbolus verrucosus]
MRHKFRTAPSAERSEIDFYSKPHGVPTQKHHKINIERKYQPYNAVRHPNLKSQQAKNEFKASASTNEWKPIFPPYMINTDQPFFKEFKSPIHKNYGDDKTHEPDDDTETIEEIHVHQEKPSSPHEVPLDIPTRPIYPGEGQWAKKGRKHRPFISKHKFTEPNNDEDEETPEGYEVFEKNQRHFDKREDFQDKIKEIPQKHNLGTYSEENEETEDIEEDEDKQQFVPTKLYAQVRRSENVEHLPKLVEDPRLREVIKDSKIQTVYTEEGYEDIAYDHAGHEKNAEENEGSAEFDKEIELEKQKKAQKLQAEEEEEDENDSHVASSQHHVMSKPIKMKKGSLTKTEETKTSSVKDKENGNSELEVVDEVKILATPNNGTKTHRYVKIFPKVYRYDISTEAPTTTISKTSEMLPMESIKMKSFHTSKRVKRFTNDFPKITIDTDFIDKIEHGLPQLRKSIDEKPKYPYYNDPKIHPDSPLRYAEDLDNIPKKTEDELAFYHQADKIKCPEVQDNVDPIPARIKNADADPENMEETTDIQELVQGPRLKNLGDKIDCFKLKYFGENPLDSPIFKEDIGPVAPIFDVIKTNGKRGADFNLGLKPTKVTKFKEKLNEQDKAKSEIIQKNDKEQFALNILTDVIGQFNKPKDTQVAATTQGIVTTEKNEIKNEEDKTEDTVISIITTPKYTIDLKPKHIYHQIELLEYLPELNNEPEDLTNSTTESQPNLRQGKSIEESTTVAATDEEQPETLALRKRRRRIRPRRPSYHIFDVNKFLPTSSYTFLNKAVRASTVLPKRELVSEVHYKNDIKPSEQLTVFADIINNIKNSSKDPLQVAASTDSIAVKLNLFDTYQKIPHIKNLNNFEETNNFYLSTTTVAPPRGTIKYSSYKNKEHLYEDTGKYENLELLKVKRKTTSVTTTTEPYFTDNKASESSDELDKESTSEVLGLVPPILTRYKTIYSLKPTKPEIVEETKMNHFYVLGMKPPSPKQKIYLYSDFKLHPSGKMKYPYRRRGKRNAQRPAYSEVVRNRNKPIDVDDDTEVVVEDDDDYVPHRPRNYHYDEKTGRIIYDNVKKEETEPEEEYIEVTEAPLPKPTRRNAVTTPKFENYTGPSYIDFVKKLKSDPKYLSIPDPTTTEKGKEEITTTTTTAQPVSTNPPEFLNILAKVKSDSSYKAIEDKTTTKRTTTTTVEPVEEETQLENVQNSPGGQDSGQNFQIFDISEYLPKVKSYSPRTSIDYSKYKTIQRSNVPLRHNLSSRYNSDDEDLEDVRTSKVPVLLEERRKTLQETEINPVVSESKHEDVEPSTSTTTEIPSTRTTRRNRTRSKSRGTRRPAQRGSAVTTSDPVSETEPVPARHDKPRRTYPRRRPTRIKIDRTTTEQSDPEEEEEEETTKIIRRRHQIEADSPAPVIEDRIDSTPTEKKYKIVTPDEKITELNKTKTEENPRKAEPRKIDHVQVFQQYDDTKKHGGNYKRENESGESKKVHEIKRLTDIVPKPSVYYNDPKLPKKINQLKEVEETEVEIEESKDENEEAAYDYEGEEEKTTTTKKPVFVKDPNQRLYYYAPI